MGAPMANNLLQKGHKLVVYDLVKASVDSAVAAGATAATSPAQVNCKPFLLHSQQFFAALYFLHLFFVHVFCWEHEIQLANLHELWV